MKFTPKSVIYPSSANKKEILVAGENEDGVITNVTVVDESLGAEFAKINDDRKAELEAAQTAFQSKHDALSKKAFTAAVKQAAKE